MKNRFSIQPGLALITAMICMLTVSFTGCDTGDDSCTGGSGGNVTLILKPEHHGESIYSQTTYLDSAFIAFEADNFPGDDPALYDIVATGVAGSNEVVVSGLKCGQYYIFMAGFDTSIVERVKGGIPFDFNTESGTITVVVPVTED